ncbi:AsmA family protein [Ferrimonas balearica DSM 9799]|uniref:AsmA family protein n=1 Tax=Ferrimonas balearica (strain DSM 9799 / CCM 4581 / KCTC 23876 / PAT) TaxID=550540 RepID=E1SP60_FERBD|nr:AsmA family protein [Ferrimonas balearica]ADN75685.1 AsmA family protein [Ferrimonas balearica DSM 9799]
MKVIKWLLLGLLTVVVVLTLYLAFFFDLNSFKGPIADKVKQATGRELVIGGDIGWSVYPTLGLELAQVQLGNLPGEQLPPLLSVEQASVGVALLPLLKRELQVEELAVSGVHLELVTLADGRSSLTGLGGEGAAKPSEAAPATDSSAAAPKRWVLGHLAVNDLTIHNDNRAAGADQTLAIKQLELARIEPERAAPLRLQVEVGDGDLAVSTQAEAMLTVSADFSRFQIDDWRQQLEAKGSAIGAQPLALSLAWDADLNLAEQQFVVTNLEFKLADFILNGEAQANLAGVRPAFQLTAKGNALNLDPWLPADIADKGTDKSEPAPESAPAPQEEPDLSAMKLLDLDADLHLGALKARGIEAEDLALKLRLNAGVLTLENASGKAFGGQLTAKASLDGTATPARYSFDQRIEHLSIQPMLKALADTDLLAGTGEFSLKGKGQGLTGKALNNLTATGALALEDGAVYGVNVAQMIREAEAKLKGDFKAEVAEQKTDFSNFHTQLVIEDGTLGTPGLKIASPLLRIEGDGKVAIEPQTLDYQLVVALVGSLEGQGGKGLDELKEIPIPLSISGPITNLSYGLDTDALLKGKLDQEKDKLEEKLKDKLFERLGNF